MDNKLIESRFADAPGQNQKQQVIRNILLRAALDINNIVPESDGKDAIIDGIEETMHKAVDRCE